MKIIHTTSGKAYELNPDTRLEIERPNLFFNDWGEQTLPTDLPDTDLNRSLTGYPDLLSNIRKPAANIECVIQEGDYHMPCRQAILGAKRHEKISTSFYMNEGSFLAKISDVSLSEVFGTEVIPGVSTVQQGIDFCFSLRNDTHPEYSIFPILVDLDGDRRMVNRFSYLNAAGDSVRPGQGTLAFYNSIERKEMVNNRFIKLEPGYYISPFIRASFVLRRIFTHFGYTLLDHFLLSGEPFGKMVFINNTIDSLVNETIMLAHLVPDCMCSTVLNVYRRKFGCEFIPDEVARTVRIELFKDLVDAKPSVDLTSYLTAHPEVSFEEYRQIRISSENVITEGDTYNGPFEIESKYPEAWYNESDGGYYRTGYGLTRRVERLSDGNLPYYAGGILKVHDVTVPDSTFALSSFDPDGTNPRSKYSTTIIVPYIGNGRTLNSTLEGAASTTNNADSDNDTEAAPESSEGVADNAEQKPVLALVRPGSEYSSGTNHNVAGYSLLYNGSIGIYEKFYRPMDNMLRNSMHKVSADFLLPESLKNSLSAHAKVRLRDADLLFNVLKYTIGGDNEPVSSELMTTALYQPLSLARPEFERMVPEKRYKWQIVINATKTTREEYLAQGYPDEEPKQYVSIPADDRLPFIYPAPPTESQYRSGGNHFPRTFYSVGLSRTEGKVYYKHEWSLRPVLISDKDIVTNITRL